MITFNYTHLNIPGKITPGQVIPLEFPFTGDSSEISQVAPSCGCTANCDIKSDKITAIFTNTEVTSFTKTINVFLKDKSTIKLTFSGVM